MAGRETQPKVDPVVSGEPQSYGMTRPLPVSILGLLGGCLKCRWLLQGPSIPPVLGLLNTEPLTPQVPTSVVMPCGGFTGRRTYRWTQPPLSCWPQWPTDLASLVGGAWRSWGLCLQLVSAGGRDTELEREPTGNGTGRCQSRGAPGTCGPGQAEALERSTGWTAGRCADGCSGLAVASLSWLLPSPCHVPPLCHSWQEATPQVSAAHIQPHTAGRAAQPGPWARGLG